MADNSLISNIQSKVQNAKKQIEKWLEIATTALKEWSTQTPKTSETPKVISEPKATASTTTTQGTINISKTPQTYWPTASATTSFFSTSLCANSWGKAG